MRFRPGQKVWVGATEWDDAFTGVIMRVNLFTCAVKYGVHYVPISGEPYDYTQIKRIPKWRIYDIQEGKDS